MQNRFELYQQWNLLPELAVEAHDLLRGEHGGEIPGVQLTETAESHATVHTVTILNSQGSRIMQKPEGTYVTIFSRELACNHYGILDSLVDVTVRHLRQFIQLPSLNDPALATGNPPPIPLDRG